MSQSDPNYSLEALPRNGYAVSLFSLCFVFSYLDRQIVSILVQPLKESLSLSDTQIGLLQGFAFTICYATAGVVVAQLVDRTNRVRLIGVCVAIWAASTVLSATAHSFGELLVYRAGTAVAEAALSPAVLSLFSDMYSPRQVSRPTSAFMLAPYVGSGLALVGGGLLLDWMAQGSQGILVSSLSLAPWRIIFILVGAAGLPLALLVAFTLREPKRVENGLVNEGGRGQPTVAPPMKSVLKVLLYDKPFCVPYFLAYTSLILVFYSFTAWFPTLLIRHFTLAPGVVGNLAGPAYMAGGIVGVICARLLIKRASDEETLEKALRISTISTTVLVPLTLAASLAPTFHAAAVLYGVCAFTASIVMALAPIPIQVALPNRMRGRSIALLVFLTNSIGGGIGPFAVGFLNQHFPFGLGAALAIVCGIAAAASAVLYFVASNRAAREMSTIVPSSVLS